MFDGNGGRRGKLKELAESHHGAEIYSLHDNGFSLAESQADITPIQKYVYTYAKQYHQERQQKRAKKNQQSSLKNAQGMTNGGIGGH